MSYDIQAYDDLLEEWQLYAIGYKTEAEAEAWRVRYVEKDLNHIDLRVRPSGFSGSIPHHPRLTFWHTLMKLGVRWGEFKLSSGKTSDFFVDVKSAALSGTGFYALARLYNTLDIFNNAAVVAGVALGGCSLTGAAVASCFGGPNIPAQLYVRKETKDHGTKKLIEGLPLPTLLGGSKVILLEDVITTGGSVMRAAKALEDAQCPPDMILAVVDRQEGGVEVLRAAGYDVRVLYTRDELRPKDG